MMRHLNLLNQKPPKFQFKYKITNKELIVKFDSISKFYCQQVLLNKNQLYVSKSIATDYELEVHDNYIKFRNVKGQSDHQSLIEVLNTIFSSIHIFKVSETKLHQQNKFNNLCKYIGLTVFDCYKLIREKLDNLNIGDLLLYYHPKEYQKALGILNKIIHFQEEELIFPMDEYLEKIDANSNYTIDLLRAFIQKLYPKIEEITEKTMLILISVQPLLLKNPSKYYFGLKGKAFLKFKVQGVSKKFIQYYFRISDLIQMKSVKIIRIEEVKSCKISQLSEHLEYRLDICLLNCKVIALFDFKEKLSEFYSKIRTGPHLISTEITKEGLMSLKREEKQYKQKMRQSIPNIQSLDINNSRIIITCNEIDKNTFLHQTKEYLENIHEIQRVCDQFDSKMLVTLFLNYFKEQFLQKYYVAFRVQNDKLIRRNYEHKDTDIQGQLWEVRKSMMEQLIRVPTLMTPQEKPEYNIIKRPKDCKRQYLGYSQYESYNGLSISLCAYDGLCTIHEHLIFIADSDIPEDSELSLAMQNNDLKVQNFLQNATNKKEIRLSQYGTPYSRFYRHIVGWFINVDQKRKIKTDLQNLIKKVKDNQRVHFVFPKHNVYLVTLVVQMFLLQLDMIQKHKTIPLLWRQIVFYYSDQNTMCTIQRKLLNMHIKRKSLLHIPTWNLDKIVNLQYYTLFIYDRDTKTKQLSSLSSFIFHHERNKIIPKPRIPLIIPKKNIIRQYLIDYTNDQYFVLQYQRVSKTKYKHKIQNIPNQTIKKIGKIIHNYFKKLQYLVIPQTIQQSQYQMEELDFYFIEGDKAMNKMKLDIIHQKITILKGEKQILYHLKQNKYLDWFIIQTLDKQHKNLKKNLKNQKQAKNNQIKSIQGKNSQKIKLDIDF